jgi:hypothetical protein
VKVHFASVRKEARASEVRKVVEKNLTLSWLLVGNSSYLNGDVEIMCGDFELQIALGQICIKVRTLDNIVMISFSC